MPIKKDPKVEVKEAVVREINPTLDKPKSILDDLDLSFDEVDESSSPSIDDQVVDRVDEVAIDLVGTPDFVEEKKPEAIVKTGEPSARNFVTTTIEESESRNRVVINGLRNNNRNRPPRMRVPQRNSTQSRVSGGYQSAPSNSYQQNNQNYQSNSYQNNSIVDDGSPAESISGVLDLARDGHGVLRVDFANPDLDAYISSSQIKRFKLRPGDMVTGPARKPKENERYWGLLKVDKVNDLPIEESMKATRPNFQRLTPVYPDEHIKLEIGPEPLSLRIIDMIAPIGKGQRSLIVSPPKAGKTTLLKDIATGVAQNNPEIHIIAVLVGERPEEVTDIRRHIDRITKGKGEVSASNFDESAQDQVRAAEIALERAKRMVEVGKDVLILLDSITRLARAYNLAMPTSGRTLSGGFDPAALFPPKKFFGAARNFEIPGSLTIVGTALVDTGSRMDDLIYEEFKGTGNQEVHLDRRLAERRVHPSIEVQRSGTRRDDLLIDPMTYQAIATLHRMLDTLDREERTITLLDQMKRSKSNKEFLASLKEG
jgi:transcription termination factor Rho